MKGILLIIHLALGMNFSFGQTEFAIVELDSSFVSQPIEFEFVINGVAITNSMEGIQVPVNSLGLDSINYKLKKSLGVTTMMKLRPNISYKIYYNTCSFYTLEPIENPLQGMVHFRIVGRDTSSYLVGLNGIHYRSLSVMDVDEFHYSPPSAMCRFSAKSLEVATDYNTVVAEVRFHFLHGELVAAEYNPDTNRIELSLYGHIRSKEDYRYYDLGDK